MKRKSLITIFLLITVLAVLLCGCKRTDVPDIMDKDEQTAVKMVKDAGLVPIVEYEYRELDEKNKVFMTRPRINTSVKINSEVVIYISKGSEKIMSESSYCKWTSMGKTNDKWEFTLPYVDKGVLYIDCHNVVINDAITWIESDEKGGSLAEASLTEDFEKTIPAKVKFEKDSVEPGEAQHLILAVNMQDLNDVNPANLSFNIPWEKNGEPEDFKIDFNITW